MKFYIKQPSSGVEAVFIKEFCSELENRISHGCHVEVFAQFSSVKTGLALFQTFIKCICRNQTYPNQKVRFYRYSDARGTFFAVYALLPPVF